MIAQVKARVIPDSKILRLAETAIQYDEYHGLLSEGLVGFRKDILFIDELAVSPEHRGRGTGRSLVEELVNKYGTSRLIVARPGALCFQRDKAKNSFERHLSNPLRLQYVKDKQANQTEIAKFWEAIGFGRFSFNYWLLGYTGEPNLKPYSPSEGLTKERKAELVVVNSKQVFFPH